MQCHEHLIAYLRFLLTHWWPDKKINTTNPTTSTEMIQVPSDFSAISPEAVKFLPQHGKETFLRAMITECMQQSAVKVRQERTDQLASQQQYCTARLPEKEFGIY